MPSLRFTSCSAQDQYTLAGEPLVVQAEEDFLYAADDWVRMVAAPDIAAGQGLVMGMTARMDIPAGTGGCNWLLQIRLDGALLSGTLVTPRLINKPADFDLIGTDFHFDWFGRQHRAWMTMFADGYEHDMTDAEEDFDYLFDLTGLVVPGEEFELRLVYAQKNIPAAVGHDAPVAFRNLWLGAMSLDEIQRMRDAALAIGGQRTPVPVQAEPPADEGPGEVAYELARSGRVEDPLGQVGFEDLTGWSAWSRGDVQLTVAASREQRIWRDQVLKVACEPGEGQSLLVIQPPEPIEIAGQWDAIELWAYFEHGNHLRPLPPPGVSILMEDSRGRGFEVELGDLNTQYWYVCQGLLSDREQANIAWPARFVGLVINRLKQEQGTVLYLNSIAFHAQSREPFAADPRPKRPSFPTSEDGGLPTPPSRAKTSVDTGPEAVTFTCQSPAGVLIYTVTPRTGSFDDLSATFEADGRTITLQPMAGGGVLFASAVPTMAGAANVRRLDSRMAGKRFVTRWHFTEGDLEADYEISYRLRGATMVVDATCDGGVATGIRFGRVAGLTDPTTVHVPYLKMGNVPDPEVACGDGLFVSALTDWRNCGFSMSQTGKVEVTDEGAQINVGTLYSPLTSGRRNDLRDRLMVTISPDFHDVLPNIPNPPSPNLDEAAGLMYVMGSGAQPSLWRSMKRYGLDDLIAMHFAGIWWRHAGEGFSMHHEQRPEMSDADLAQYRDMVRGLGYRWGILMEYGDFFPINEYWDPGLLSLTTDGTWATRWIGHYATKPAAMTMLARVNGERLQEHCGLESVYLDTHTNHSLTAKDYEAGVPGAGSAPSQALQVGEMLLEARRQHGLTCSEGIYRWLYAGLVDMDYATWVGKGPAGNTFDQPILPDFDLLKIHHLHLATGMGYSPSAFFGRTNEALGALYSGDDGGPTAAPVYYQYVAATLAHGHSAILGYGYFPPVSRMIHYYATMMAIQPEYLTDTVTEIMRHDGEGYISTSEALARDQLGTGRIRVRYSRGLTMWVNYHAEDSWEIDANGSSYTLPPYGWVIDKPGELLAFSALIDGHRVDYARCPKWTYLSGCGERTQYDGIDTDGAVWLRRDGSGARVIPCGRLERFTVGPGDEYPYQHDYFLGDTPADRGCTVLRIDAEKLMPGCEPRAIKVRARDWNEVDLEPAVEVSDDGVVSFTASAEVVDWIIAR